MAIEKLFALLLAVAVPSAVRAGDEQESDALRSTVKESPPPAPKWPDQQHRPEVDEALLYEFSDQVDAASAVEEILDELASDIAQLGPGAVSPVIIDRVEVSPNLDPRYAAVLESRLIAALYRTHGVKVVLCLECRTTQMNVQEGAWHIQQGLSRKEQLAHIAQEYGARTVLRGRLTLKRDPDALALDVQLARTDSAAVVFAEGYRFDAEYAMLYRGSDAAAARELRRQDLQDRIDNKPHFGHEVFLGAMSVPEGHGLADTFEHPIVGGTAMYRLYESFGTYRQFRVGINAGGFMHSSRLAGGIVGVSLHGRVHRFSLFGPQVFVGGMVGGFLTGGGGNTVMGGLSCEVLLGSRIVLHGGVNWIHPFVFAKERDIGGLSPQGGVAFLW